MGRGDKKSFSLSVVHVCLYNAHDYIPQSLIALHSHNIERKKSAFC